MTAATITQNVAFIDLGDSVAARFLKEGDLVIATGGRYFEIGAARCDGDTNVVFSATNELGGIEAVEFERDTFVPLLTAL
jgi:hypothetical protein